ncbi:MAG TPA: hypothetical protein DEA22_01305, partial [Blastocatellia bacterium]|nr:hypothetical protein [Blastocatellia bacterium]
MIARSRHEMKVSRKPPFIANSAATRLQSIHIDMRCLLFSALLVSGLAGACANYGSSSQNAQTPSVPVAERQADNPAKVANDSTEELAELITLPFEPVEVEWREQSAAAGGTSASAARKITAVIRFSSEHAKRIAADAAKLGTASTSNIETEEWYPEELIAHSEMNGDSGLAATIYPANGFYRPPFSGG